MRISDDDWGALETATGTQESDRGTVIKQFIRWYLRRPGAKLPARPLTSEWAELHAQRMREEAERKAREAAGRNGS